MFRNRTFPFQKNWRNGQSLCGELSDWCSAVFPARFSPNNIERKRDLITARVVSPLLNWLLFVDRHEKGGSPTVNKPLTKKINSPDSLRHYWYTSAERAIHSLYISFFYVTSGGFRPFSHLSKSAFSHLPKNSVRVEHLTS